MQDPDSSGNEPPDGEDPPDREDTEGREGPPEGGAPPAGQGSPPSAKPPNGERRRNGEPPPKVVSPPKLQTSPTNGQSAPSQRRTVDPDQDILDLIQARKYDKALVMLMDRHEQGVFRFCCTLLRDDELAKDVTQITFIQAYRDMKTFAGRSTLRSWLFAIAKHRSWDSLRPSKVVKQGTPLDESTIRGLEDPSRSPDMRISDTELAEALRGCLESLSEDEISAVLLRYQQGMSFEEISQDTGEKPGTLQARVARAVDKVRRCIEKKTGGTL